jgi:hypothetical protein
MMSAAWVKVLDRFLSLTPGDRDLRRSLRLVRYGFRHRPVRIDTIAVADLRVRKEPTLIPAAGTDPESRYARPARVLVNPVDRFFPLRDGHEDRRLIHLPHMAVLRHFEATGRMLEDSDYERLIRVRAALQGRPVRDEEIASRLARLVATWRSIRDRGYLGPGHRRQRIVVMEGSTHPPTATYRPEGLEVYDGHHRAVAVTYLGLDRVEVLVTRAEQVAPFDWTAEPFDAALWERARGSSPAAPARA